MRRSKYAEKAKKSCEYHFDLRANLDKKVPPGRERSIVERIIFKYTAHVFMKLDLSYQIYLTIFL